MCLGIAVAENGDQAKEPNRKNNAQKTAAQTLRGAVRDRPPFSLQIKQEAGRNGLCE